MDGLRLKNAREKAGHTQKSLAEFIHIHDRNITRYENGDSEPSADVLARLADALQVSADYLLGLTDDPTPKSDTSDLSPRERAVVSAMRRGDYPSLLRAIVNEF